MRICTFKRAHSVKLHSILKAELGISRYITGRSGRQDPQMAAKRRKGSAWMEEVIKKEWGVLWLSKLCGGQLVQKVEVPSE